MPTAQHHPQRCGSCALPGNLNPHNMCWESMGCGDAHNVIRGLTSAPLPGTRLHGPSGCHMWFLSSSSGHCGG